MSFTFGNAIRSVMKTTELKSKVPFAFTSSTGMDADQIYTSGWVESADYDTIRGIVYISGSEIGETIGGTFKVQQSFNNTGTNVELTGSQYTVNNGYGEPFSETVYARYARLVYTNNSASGSAFNTGSFAVQCYLVG